MSFDYIIRSGFVVAVEHDDRQCRMRVLNLLLLWELEAVLVFAQIALALSSNCPSVPLGLELKALKWLFLIEVQKAR